MRQQISWRDIANGSPVEATGIRKKSITIRLASVKDHYLVGSVDDRVLNLVRHERCSSRGPHRKMEAAPLHVLFFFRKLYNSFN